MLDKPNGLAMIRNRMPAPSPANCHPPKKRKFPGPPALGGVLVCVLLAVTGPGPSLTISEAWINAVAGSQYFANPLQGATTVNSDSTISFPFTISVTPAASLSKNASLK